MDIFFYGLDVNLSEKRLANYLRQQLKPFGIAYFELEKISHGRCALLTVPDPLAGRNFIAHYNERGRGLFLNKKRFSCKEGRDPPDKLKLGVLRKKISDAAQYYHTGRTETQPPQENRAFVGATLACGTWDYHGDELVFVGHYIDHRGFTLHFGHNTMVIVMIPQTSNGPSFRLDIAYSTIQCIVYKGLQDTIITFTLYRAPKIYRTAGQGETRVEVEGRAVGVRDRPDRFGRNIRVSGVSPMHTNIAGTCFAYQLNLRANEVRAVRNLLKYKSLVPKAVLWPFRLTPVKVTFVTGMQNLERSFNQSEYRHLGFSVKFQVQRLAQNGYLPPSLAKGLLPAVASLAKRRGTEVTTQALQRLFREIPYAGPESHASYFDLVSLERRLQELEKSVLRGNSFAFEMAGRYSHLVLVHRVRVTPTGVYLEGPELEPKNHVLRRYEDRAIDSFLRVSFEEEDGDSIRFDSQGTLEVIHYGRYKRLLEHSITIAGRHFTFLGFSHSSLRDQTCWFMTPFDHRGTLWTPDKLIRSLGDFSAIHCPAKCAARIGQNFTDLNSFVEIPSAAIREVPDIERSSRVFSDGCSAVSPAIMKRIWKEAELLSFKATVFQFRLGGAKGMISLNPRLQGDKFELRPSQVKFPAEMTGLGICGVAKRPLPFYLNRPMIKVLEDLGVDTASFQTLQDRAIQKLRAITNSPINAAGFLRRSDVGIAAHLTWLFEKLNFMGIPVIEDRFLWSIIELTVLTNLRDLKHRMRIPVDKGVTLYGVMDESDTLTEGEIYVSANEREEIIGPVAITRSPALHPGDIQLANAVSVAKDSPLRCLYNCVVFSQRGQRDLPSQLSGGDLDGDHFNIWYEPLIMPKQTTPAANYPRVPPLDIGRTVETADMIDFMVNFMANDQLGRIATMHLALADYQAAGVFNSDCLELADLHSTAVDFTKTGIPVCVPLYCASKKRSLIRHCQANMSRAPRISRRYRPDFMAPGPRVVVEKGLSVFEPRASLFRADEEDPVEELNPESFTMRYYESKKALGVLYRAIDERAFIKEIQSHHATSTTDLLSRIWGRVREKTLLVEYGHLVEWAQEIKEESAYDFLPFSTFHVNTWPPDTKLR